MPAPADPLPPPGPPAAEVSVDEALVSSLLADQHPGLAGLPVRAVGDGWDNATFRLGDDLAVRLPRRAAAVPLLRNEQTWLARIAPDGPISVPHVVRTGQPGGGYPWPWSVVTWIPGRPAAASPVEPDQAGPLGEFLAALHGRRPPDDAPRNPYRGVPLAARISSVEPRLDRIVAQGGGLPAPAARVRQAWRTWSRVPIDTPEAWLHGDLHARNVIVDGGRVAGIVDWGDLCSGDRATDLAAPWLLLPVAAHAEFWDAYGPVTAATADRARGWALFFGVMLLDAHHRHDDEFAATGRTALRRLLAPQEVAR